MSRRTLAGALAALLSFASPADANAPATEAAATANVPQAAEAAYFRLMDEAIAGARDQTPSVEQLTLLKETVAAVAARDLAKARGLRERLEDPAARKLADWHRLRVGYGEASEYRAFLDQNPHWPDRVLLQKRGEEALFTQGGAASALKAWFKGAEPQTGIGWAVLASAALAEGKKDEARALAVRAWRQNDIAATLETGFIERFGELLGPADHKWRLDTILIDDPRWARERSERAAQARRQIARLPEAEKKKAEARFAAFQRAGNAQALMDAIPADSAKGDLGFLYQRIQLMRRAGKLDEAAKLMLGVALDIAELPAPDGWWDERRALAYAALRGNRPQQAYDLVRVTGGLSVNPRKEQQFMAGWLALRRLDSPQMALDHFQALRKSADGPLSIARAEYWLGRAQEKLGARTQAESHYKAAAERFDTFHGQLARQKLAKGSQALPVGPPAAPTADEIKAFNANDAVRATVLARKAGLDDGIVRSMLGGLRNGLKSEAELAMNAHLAEALGDTQMAVRIAKWAIGNGRNLVLYGYPTHPFPKYTPLRSPPEMAFLLAITRQESEFNTRTVSGAGARGLMQVMPITARHVCRDYKLKCEIDRLLTDKPYNAMISSAYIGDRMQEFAGSYVLGMAGYNAGPGRARQWIREFGDPRDAKVDPIDWIERIPIQETREYVAKVLSNVQVYRARLGEAKPLRLEDDLLRARGRADVPKGDDKDETGTAGGGG
jgi:soluble lytic murein transglycosylase